MDIDWDEIKKVLASKNLQRIEEAKIKVLDNMCCIAKEKEKQGVTIQGITAVTLAHNEIELHKKPSDSILLFRQELLHTFIGQQHMSLYRNPKELQEEDAIVLKCGRSGRIAYDVVKVEEKGLVVKPVGYMDGRDVEEQTVKVTGRNFICGIRLNETATDISAFQFFFFDCN